MSYFSNVKMSYRRINGITFSGKENRDVRGHDHDDETRASAVSSHSTELEEGDNAGESE
jgi:hypothetical protein